MTGTTIGHLIKAAKWARGDSPADHRPTALGTSVPWDFEARAQVLGVHASCVLDLTTGTGEILRRILDGIDTDTPPMAVAADRRARHLTDASAHLGDRVTFLRASPQDIPFADGVFDLILLRHRPFDPWQIAAAIPPGGALLAEQIHVSNWHELRRHFPRAVAPPDDLERMKKQFRRAGFELIDVRIHHRPLVFNDLAHLVRALTAAPWVVPDFDVEADIDALLALDEDLHDERGIVMSRSRYILEVHRPRPLD